MQVAQDAPLKPSMDIFAVGWVLAFISLFITFKLGCQMIYWYSESGSSLLS